MEHVKKDVITLFSSKRESFLGLYVSFPWGYRGKKYELLLSTFRNNSIPLRKAINELLNIYPRDLFNLDYLELYWVFDVEEKISNKKKFKDITMPIDSVKFYTYFSYPFTFYEYMLQKNIDDYEAQNDNIKVRQNPVLFKYATVITLSEANEHCSKHGLEEIFESDKKRWKC